MRILVPLDGSKISEAVLEPVRNLARAAGATVELLRVVPADEVKATAKSEAWRETVPAGTTTGTRVNVPMLGDMVGSPVENREQAFERVEAEVKEYLADQVARLDGISTTTTVLYENHPAAAIIAYARANMPDMIAMATHGRTGLSHMIAGSVTEEVIRSGTVPVLAVRPGK